MPKYILAVMLTFDLEPGFTIILFSYLGFFFILSEGCVLDPFDAISQGLKFFENFLL